MEAQEPVPEHHTDVYRGNELERKSKPLFTCQIQDDLTTPAEAISYACLEALDRLAEDAFSAADMTSQQLASGKMRPIGRRLDGLRLRLKVWMIDVGLDAAEATSASENGVDYFELAAGRKLRAISQSCKTIASCLNEMLEDFQFMASDLETAGRARTSSVTRKGELINAALDDMESTIHNLTGLVTPILMTRALRTGTGQYSEVHQQANTILHGPMPSALGSNADSIDTDRLSYSSGDSVFKIDSAPRAAERQKSWSNQSARASSSPPHSHSSAAPNPKHHDDLQQQQQQMQEPHVHAPQTAAPPTTQQSKAQTGGGSSFAPTFSGRAYGSSSAESLFAPKLQFGGGMSSHEHQHHRSDDELKAWIKHLQEAVAKREYVARAEEKDKEEKKDEEKKKYEEEAKRKTHEKEEAGKMKKEEERRRKKEEERGKKKEEGEKKKQKRTDEKGSNDEQLEVNQEGERGTTEMVEIKRQDQWVTREPERPDSTKMTTQAAGGAALTSGAALGGAAVYAADQVASDSDNGHGVNEGSHSITDGGHSVNTGGNRSNDSGYGGSLDDDVDEGCWDDCCEYSGSCECECCGHVCCGDGCCSCGGDNDDDEGCCFGWC